MQVDGGELNPKLFESPTTRRLKTPPKTPPSPSSQKKLKVPAERVDIIKGGKRMERERTLMDCGVGFGFVLYLKVDEGEHYVDLTGVVAEGDGGTRVRVSRVKRSEDGGWVVVGEASALGSVDGTFPRAGGGQKSGRRRPPTIHRRASRSD